VTVPVEPWQVWWLDFDPTAGRKQAGQRPAVVVSSRFHLAITGGGLITVLPLTTRERPDWPHRIQVDIPGQRTGWAIAEQVRTVSRARLAGRTPIARLTDTQAADVRTVLAKMLDV
jgi:mRNA interferase MazF